MRILFLNLLYLLAASLPAQTLDDYLKTALDNNPGIQSKQMAAAAAREKLPQAKALPDPTLNAALFLRPMMLPMGNQLGSVSAMQMFPWFGARAAAEAAAAQAAEVQDRETDIVRNALVFKVKNAWFPLLELNDQIRIRRENLRILETDKALATAKFQQGQAPMVDAIRADLMLDELKTELALLEQKRRPLEVVFNRLLNRADTSAVIISGNLSNPTPAAVVDRPDSLLDRNPGLLVIDQQINAAEAGEKAAAFQRKPMIGAGLQYMPLLRRKSGDLDLPPNTGRDMLMPMVSVSIPLWRKKYEAAMQEQRMMQGMYEAMKLEMKNELAAEYEMARYESKSMAQTIELLDRQAIKTQQAIDLLIAAYSNDGQDFDSILQMQRQLFQYQMEKVSMQAGYQLTLAKLDYLTGN